MQKPARPAKRSGRADNLTPAQRSECMRRVKGRDTKPEMIVRRIVHGMGFRYRLHDARLPGRPDLVLPARGRVIFVHGCFWHLHRCPKGTMMPQARADYWLAKLSANQARDRAAIRKLRRSGWRVLVVWECELRNHARIKRRLRSFFTHPGK